MLGSDLLTHLRARGHEPVAPASTELDVTDPVAHAEIVTGKYGEFRWCVNCAAYTAVDKAEEEVREATELNAFGPGLLARSCLMAGARLLHISTDFVFDGEDSEPYREDAPTNPLGVYGRTKREGEEAVLTTHPNAVVVRTSWLYGPNGKCFPRTIVNAWEAGKGLRVVADQVGSPTYTGDLARILVDLIERDPFPGTYHAAGPEAMSWHEVARRTLEAYKRITGGQAGILVEPIRTVDWPTPARRPRMSALSSEKLLALGIPPMQPIDEALEEFCRRLAQGWT